MDGEIDVIPYWKQHDSFRKIGKSLHFNLLRKPPAKSGKTGIILPIIQGRKDLKQASTSMATLLTFMDADV